MLACRCLSKKKKKKLGENWIVHSIEVYCSGLPSNRNGFIRFQFNSSFSLVYIEFLVRSSCSSAYMIAPKADPVRLESKRMKSLWQLQYFTTLTPSGLTRQIRQLFPWRYIEFIPKDASSNKGGLSPRIAWTWKFWIRSVHVICARLVDRSNYGPFSKSAPFRDPTSSSI